MLDQKIQNTLSQVEQLKEDQLVLMFPYDVLKIIHNLDITTSLDESYYVQHKIKKRNGSVRILNEPKPNLKLVQSKLLDIINYFAGNINAKLSSKNKLINGVIAYRKKKSVIDNANFHIGQEFVLKLDIKDFFNRVDTSKLNDFWLEVLQRAPKISLKHHVFETANSPYDLDEFMQPLALKLSYITSLNFHLAQGSPTSGALANYYLTNFDNRLLKYCIDRKLNYSRYSDDITISGKLENLNTGNMLGAIQYMLKERELTLNKTKTKLLRSNRKQMVTGIVVNVKKTAGRAYKRAIRQEVYFLKKFKEAHIQHKNQQAIKYLGQLLGKIAWVTSIEKNDLEFNKYKGELMLILRFVKSGKTIEEAIDYHSKLIEISRNLKKEQSIVIEGVEWQIEDENLADKTLSEGVYTQSKRGKNRVYFDETGLKNFFPTLKDGWRLPTVEEFKSYIKETHYNDRQILGLRVPSDPNFNGLVFSRKSYLFNKMGGYWTSDIQRLPKLDTEYAIGRNVFLSFSKNWKYEKQIDSKIEFISKSTAITAINIKNPIVKISKRGYSSGHDEYINNKPFYFQAFSIRLVRSVSPTIDKTNFNINFTSSFWKSVSKVKKSSQLAGLGIESIPDETLKEWKSSTLLLSNNQFNKGLAEYPPVLKVDLQNNSIKEFNFDKIPKTVKHLLLDGNKELEVSELPLQRYFTHLHELSLPEQFDNQLNSNFTEIYSLSNPTNNWIEIDSDEKLAELSISKSIVKHLKIIIKPGIQLIDSKTLFNRMQVFEQLVSLHILIEPAENELCQFLNGLKNKSFFTKNELDYIESIKLNNPIKNTDNQDYLQSWLYGEIDFIATDLVNQNLKNLILDFSWFKGANFKGDFDLRLERYHLLHPGTVPTNLPSTSSLTHQPNILIKTLGTNILYQQKDIENPFTSEIQKLLYIVPFAPVSIYYVFNDLFSLYPKNQRHLENIVLVLTSWETKKLPKGKVLSFFSKSNQYIKRQKEYNSDFTISRSFFNFPLLSYSLNFDVYKLNNPVKSILFKSETKGNHFTLQDSFHPLGLSESCFCYYNRSYLSFYDFQFSSENKNLLSTENYLLIQHIFPNLNSDEEHEFNYTTAKSKIVDQYKVSPDFYAEAKKVKGLNKEEIIKLIKESDFDAIHLPKKYQKDKEVMLVAIEKNPFSFVYAHKGLKKETDFILEALKFNLRTLMFFDQHFLKVNKGVKSMESIYDYLTSILIPSQFNSIINQMNIKVIVDRKSIYQNFKFNAQPVSDINNVIKSFEDEMILFDSSLWYSLSVNIKNHLIDLAQKNKFFNSNGYFTSLEEAVNQECNYLDLSYSDVYSLLNEDPSNSSKMEKLNISILNLSFTQFTRFEMLPNLPTCEVLYLDGLYNLDISVNKLNEKFPNLKQLYFRCMRGIFNYTLNYEKLCEACLKLELIDAREKENSELSIDYECSDKRVVKILGIH